MEQAENREPWDPREVGEWKRICKLLRQVGVRVVSGSGIIIRRASDKRQSG